MVLAGLSSEGTTTITNIDYIERGYEDMVTKLKNLGAQIERISDRDPKLRVLGRSAG